MVEGSERLGVKRRALRIRRMLDELSSAEPSLVELIELVCRDDEQIEQMLRRLHDGEHVVLRRARPRDPVSTTVLRLASEAGALVPNDAATPWPPLSGWPSPLAGERASAS